MHFLGKIGMCGFLGGFLFHWTVMAALSYAHGSVHSREIDTETILTFSHLFLAALSSLIVCTLLTWRCCSDAVSFQVVWRSQLLGVLLAFGSTLNVYSSDRYVSFGWYVCLMAFFHFSEFAVTSIIRPQHLSTESFLLNHSKAYFIAALASWIEFFVELWILPDLKTTLPVSLFGLLLCLSGEAARKTAMLTAFNNFDHLIRTRREERHYLVTSGIYSLCRHPSYVGWFYWSIGTQIILCNPLCTIAYAFTSWMFFRERIFEEERTLLHFFGSQYSDYQKSVPTGLPFIKGYLL